MTNSNSNKLTGHEEIEYMSRIRAQYDSLSSAEKKIADYIFDSKGEILNMSIHSLAKHVGVSSPTITRFSQNLGFRGYNELKYYIEKELLSPTGEIQPLNINDSIKVITQKLINFNKQVIDDTALTLKENELEKAIEVIAKARKIDIYGEGGSGATALSAYNIFVQIGLTCNVFNDAMLQVISASQLSSKDVAIGITHSGSVTNTIQALKEAKKQGAITIGITGIVNSPLTEVSDIVLYASAKQKPFISDLPAARISELCIISILQVGIMSLNYDNLVDNMKKAKKAMNLKRTKKRSKQNS